MAVLPADEYAGRLIITWPKANGSILVPWGVVLTDADTGEQIVSAMDMDLTVHTDPQNIVAAEMTMLCGEDGQPLAEGAKPVLSDDGENLRTGRFRWLVAEMRVAS